ncbi:pregnancy-specific beta-1-glycoprotein 11-like isoform X2 [Aquarana catesbeiana]|uniref:pregnancy-specific beta-1-glycoprotein 11-like isoform X2 n=1 Tax=Aquarana catesbeiana TaxID=8400 RepID=UPI003CCA2666
MAHIGVGPVCALLLLIQYGNGADLIITSPDPSPTIRTGDLINLTISYSSTPSLIMWTANGSLVVLWLKGEQFPAAKYKSRLTLQEKRILLNDSTTEDSGEYTVKVIDTNGDSGNFTFNVVVRDRVQEIQSNDTGIYKMGENISLTIWYDGNPLAIFWNYNSEPFAIRSQEYNYTSTRFNGRMILKESGSLLIQNTTNEDAGNYSITVRTTTVPGSRTFQVKFFDIITDVTLLQTPAIVIESTPMVNLSCRASSGSGSVTWQKDGQPLTNDSSHVLLDQALQILNPNRTFSGNYSCNMSNPVSWNVGSKVMTVYFPVESVTVTQSLQVVSESSPAVNLSCSTPSGNSEAVTWTKDGQPIINNSTHILMNGNKILQITAPKRTFSGLYSCNMSNAAYWSSGSLLLRVYDATPSATSTYSMLIITLLGGILLAH